jgi:hypothetical protein
MSNTTSSDPRHADRAADAVWRRLCAGLSESWLDDIRVLRSGGDDFEASLNIWSAGLTVELKDPDRREKASMVVSRLRKLADELEERLEA